MLTAKDARTLTRIANLMELDSKPWEGLAFRHSKRYRQRNNN